MDPNVLYTKALSIGYPTKDSLHSGISLKLKSGEITCLLGPNGSGKSTLIRTMAGFQKALSGEVFIRNNPVTAFTAGEIAKKISVVLTDEVFTGNMTVFDMVAFGRSPYTGFMGKLGKQDWQIVEQSLHDTGIAHLHSRMFPELSDGEKQKVMIAKSLAQKTPLIMLDEPTAYLDFPSKVEVLQLLRNAAWNLGKAVLLSTHDLGLALRFADNIWLMGRENNMETGLPEDLVVSGKINKFFDRRNTTFDLESGDFEFTTKIKGKVRLAGEGLKMKWLSKAMARKGFQVIQTDDAMASIFADDEKYEVEMDGDKQVLKNICGVLKLLDSKTLKTPTK